MNEMQPVERPVKPHGRSIWTYLTVALVLAGVGLGALGYALYHANSEKIRLAGELAKQQNATQRRELDAQKATANDKLTLARIQQEHLLAQVTAATNSLGLLWDGSAALRSAAAALRTNEAGRAVALHPDLVALARRCFESSLPEVPPEPDLITRLEAVRRIEQQVLAARGTAYDPAAAFGVTVQNATTWAEQGLLKLGQARDALNGVVQESKIKFTRATLTADSPTLVAAIARQNEALADGQLRQAEQTVSVARTNAVLTRAEADATAERTRAEADAQKVRAEADRYAEESRRKLAEEQAAKEQEWQRREGRREAFGVRSACCRCPMPRGQKAGASSPHSKRCARFGTARNSGRRCAFRCAPPVVRSGVDDGDLAVESALEPDDRDHDFVALPLVPPSRTSAQTQSRLRT